MNHTIRHLEPQRLWTIFEEICAIPHPSKHEARIIEYVKGFGEKLGLDTQVDQVGNIVIRKPATPGLEDRKTIVLQGHLDMVPQKNNDTTHDFEKDPIRPVIDGEWVKASGTTLGADNGIGVAAAMAVLASNDLEHGPIECLFTVDEETGMTGAFGIQPGFLRGDILINLDSEDEGELYIGCAGAIDTNATFPCPQEPAPAGHRAFTLEVKGLRGGHSGLDIHLGRGNANKILTRLLWTVHRELGARLAAIEGGSLRNAIPREASAIVTVDEKRAEGLKMRVAEIGAMVSHELSVADPELSIRIAPADMPGYVMESGAANRLLSSLYGCPNGVMRMDASMPGVVETSTNLAIVRSKDDTVEVATLQRSSVDSAKEDLCQMIRSVLELGGAEVQHAGAYPGWKPNVDSPILKTMKEVYNKKFGKVPQQKVIHAGLECGLLGGVYPALDMISFGPTIRNPHSPDEKVHTGTVGQFWEFLVETLRHAPVK